MVRKWIQRKIMRQKLSQYVNGLTLDGPALEVSEADDPLEQTGRTVTAHFGVRRHGHDFREYRSQKSSYAYCADIGMSWHHLNDNRLPVFRFCSITSHFCWTSSSLKYLLKVSLISSQDMFELLFDSLTPLLLSESIESFSLISICLRSRLSIDLMSIWLSLESVSETISPMVWHTITSEVRAQSLANAFIFDALIIDVPLMKKYCSQSRHRKSCRVWKSESNTTKVSQNADNWVNRKFPKESIELQIGSQFRFTSQHSQRWDDWWEDSSECQTRRTATDLALSSQSSWIIKRKDKLIVDSKTVISAMDKSLSAE